MIETIAAVATAPGESGTSIVRISGPASLRIADALFRCAAPPPSARPANTFVYGRVLGAGGETMDDALLLIFRAPHSYTGEDTVEIQGHGGNVTARRILRRALELGARLAEPGEFTKRAFLNGRMDLVQAEAVLDLIRAKSDRAAQGARLQLEGALSARLNAVYDQVLSVAANLEATLDFPDDELPGGILEGLMDQIRYARAAMDELASSWNEGHLLRDGALVVIVGKPNVGKSTLLNAMLGRARAIVSPIPGTTRDSIEEGLVLHGFPIRLVDTAGLRKTTCQIEQEGIRRTHEHLDSADLQIVVVDCSNMLDINELQFLQSSDCHRTVVVLNKVDLGEAGAADIPPALTTVRTVLSRGEGLEALREALSGMLDRLSSSTGGQHVAVSERHRSLLTQASESCASAEELLASPEHADTELVAQELRQTLEALGLITGRIYHADLLESIFSRFCIGK